MDIYALPTGTFVLASMEENKVCRNLQVFQLTNVKPIFKLFAMLFIYGMWTSGFHNPNPHLVQGYHYV